MYAEEVDLNAFKYLAPHAKLDGHTGDESDELPGFGSAYSNVPVVSPPRRFQCPSIDQ